jgi:photosystem II stability/assembly factor-like uncharacterized protein
MAAGSTKRRASVLWIATRKGAWRLRSDGSRRGWKLEGPQFLGHIVHHLVADPRNPRVLVAGVRTGHLGPTVFRSTDRGRTWQEARQPPKFAPPRATAGATTSAEAALPARAVDHVFWLTPGHASQPGLWYAGTAPQGLFRSQDDGDTWEPFSPINDDPTYRGWMGSEKDGTPDGPKLHSILVDPRDPKHLYFAMSGGGVHESTDGGRSFAPLVDGLDVFESFDPANVAFHDPHCVRLCPTNPDRLYQQNHCGIYRLDRPARRWERIGRAMPPKIGDIGFPMTVHPRNADTAWVFPMDGQTVWPRTTLGGKPAVYVTRDAGRRWKRLDQGLPRHQAWWTVKRQAMTADAGTPVGLYVGTTNGEVWASRDEGARWTCIARHLPEIYALEVSA